MSVSTADLAGSRKPVRSSVAVAGVLLLWLAYTVLQMLSTLGVLGEPLYAGVSVVPGLLGVGLLLWSGRSREACFLQLRRPSGAGLAVLAGVMVSFAARAPPMC